MHCWHLGTAVVVSVTVVSPFFVVLVVVVVKVTPAQVVRVVVVDVTVVVTTVVDVVVGPVGCAVESVGGEGPGPLSGQWSVVPPGHPGALSTSNSRVAVDAACTPYGGLKLPWSMGLFLAMAHVITQDPWFLPASASFHSDRYRLPLDACG